MAIPVNRLEGNVSLATNTFNVARRTDLTVTDESGKAVPSDVIKGNNKTYSARLYFLATVPPLGFTTYFIQATPSDNAVR